MWIHPHITVLSPLPLCPRHTSFCSEPQTNSFHLETCVEGVLDVKYTYPPTHLNVLLIIQGLKQGSSFSLVRIRSCPSEYLPQVVIIYLIVGLLHLFPQPKMC